MAHDDLIPPDVDKRDAALLRRAYALTNLDDGMELYTEWASTYDRTMIEGLGYISHRRLVDVLCQHVLWRDRAVVDIGCGTGLVGVELAVEGFTTIDGLDLSTAMIAQASDRGCYRRLVEADLTGRLPLDDHAYGAVVCNGTFTSGHVDASCLGEIIRLLEPGGVLACAVHHAVWHSGGFAEAFERLTESGELTEQAIVESAYYLSSVDTDGRLCVFATRPG